VTELRDDRKELRGDGTESQNFVTMGQNSEVELRGIRLVSLAVNRLWCCEENTSKLRPDNPWAKQDQNLVTTLEFLRM
jgi:hypothetical protein